MKLIFGITLIWVTITGCQNNNNHKPDQIEIAKNKSSTDTTIVSKKISFHFTTTNIEGDLVTIIANAGNQPALCDTLSATGLANPEFPDFNKDGYPDILLTYKGNSTTTFLYLFDPVSGSFNSVTGFANFPAAKPLRLKPGYYFTFYNDGCNDQNWISDLFKLEAFKAIKIGHIYGKGCDFNVLENPKFIGIHKIDPNNSQSEELIEKLPYEQFIPVNKDKSAFLEKYWNNNYQKFE